MNFFCRMLATVSLVLTATATFNDLPPGQHPQTRMALVKQGDPAPAGKNSIWAGVMLVSSSNMAVAAYR